MNKKEFQETEEAFRAYFRKGRTEEPEEYPEFQPDFEDIKRRLEEVESGKRVLPPLSPTPEEWNRQVRAERRQLARKIAFIAAAVVVVIGVAGGAYWLGRESVVVPNPDSSAAESSEVVESKEDTSNPTDRPVDDTVLTYEEIIQLTGLSLVKADDMPRFQKYVVDDTNGKVTTINYLFEDFKVSIYDDTDFPPNSELLLLVYENREFLYKETSIEGIGNQIAIYYVSPSGVLFVGNMINKTVDESVQLLNVLIFE